MLYLKIIYKNHDHEIAESTILDESEFYDYIQEQGSHSLADSNRDLVTIYELSKNPIIDWG